MSLPSDSPISIQDPSVKARIQELRRTDNWTNLLYLARTWAFLAIVIGGAVAIEQSRAAAGWGWWWSAPVFALAIVAVGACQHQLTGLAHEASHHTLFSNRQWNDLVSDWLCMFPMFSTTHHYRLQHIAHHQFTNDPDRDPDVSQLKSSGHWLPFPMERKPFLRELVRQLWLPNLVKYIRIRALYNAVGTDKNPYVRQGTKSPKTATLVGVVFLLALVSTLTALSAWAGWTALVAVPLAMGAAVVAFYAWLPERYYSNSRIRPNFTPRVMTMMRMSFFTLLFSSIAWLQRGTGAPVAFYFFLLWVVPIFTSFSFFMVLRQLVQHGNADRGWMTNTRTFLVQPLIRLSVFPMGQDYHLPHHMYASVPHYRLKELHELLSKTREYQQEAVVVEGYLHPPVQPPRNPTVVDVVGPEYALLTHPEHVDHSVLDGMDVENKAELLAIGKSQAVGG